MVFQIGSHSQWPLGIPMKIVSPLLLFVSWKPKEESAEREEILILGEKLSTSPYRPSPRNGNLEEALSSSGVRRCMWWSKKIQNVPWDAQVRRSASPVSHLRHHGSREAGVYSPFHSRPLWGHRQWMLSLWALVSPLKCRELGLDQTFQTF